tara:strand:- start:507 stop:1595 length:1089 start_codon:yes stop_codon:yes gene_type:complete
MRIKLLYFILSLSILTVSCQEKVKQEKRNSNTHQKIRNQVDTVGFAQYNWQMDSVLARIAPRDKIKTDAVYKAVICPHDDYAYAAGLYAKTLAGIKAKTVILIGVAHRARNFELQDKLIFGSYNAWKSPDGLINISTMRNKLISSLSKETYIVHDSMMQLEHSLEAITPFLKRNNPKVEIIPILVPYMAYDQMEQLSSELSKGLDNLMKEGKMKYGKDLAVVISNDAVHYGDKDWGGKNMAPFGVDSLGTAKTRQKDLKIISECLVNTLSPEKIRSFNTYTVQENDYEEYNWVWCGRYSVPFGLLFANKLSVLQNKKPLRGTLVDYRSSYHNPHINVENIGMGTTAPANNHHWVGYVGVSYK